MNYYLFESSKPANSMSDAEFNINSHYQPKKGFV